MEEGGDGGARMPRSLERRVRCGAVSFEAILLVKSQLVGGNVSKFIRRRRQKKRKGGE